MLTWLVEHGGTRSMDSVLLMALAVLAFVLAMVRERREILEWAVEWRRLSNWLPRAAEVFDPKYAGWSLHLIAMDLIKRLKEAESECAMWRKSKGVEEVVFVKSAAVGKSVLSPLELAARGELASEFCDCKNCGEQIVKRGPIFVHRASGLYGCSGMGMVAGAVAKPEVRA